VICHHLPASTVRHMRRGLLPKLRPHRRLQLCRVAPRQVSRLSLRTWTTEAVHRQRNHQAEYCCPIMTITITHLHSVMSSADTSFIPPSY
jgi:hypothetical protein